MKKKSLTTEPATHYGAASARRTHSGLSRARARAGDRGGGLRPPVHARRATCIVDATTIQLLANCLGGARHRRGARQRAGAETVRRPARGGNRALRQGLRAFCASVGADRSGRLSGYPRQVQPGHESEKRRPTHADPRILRGDLADLLKRCGTAEGTGGSLAPPERTARLRHPRVDLPRRRPNLPGMSKSTPVRSIALRPTSADRP